MIARDNLRAARWTVCDSSVTTGFSFADRSGDNGTDRDWFGVLLFLDAPRYDNELLELITDGSGAGEGLRRRRNAAVSDQSSCRKR